MSSERRRAKRVQEFYRAQNANIARLLTPVDEHRSQAREDRHSSQLRYRLAVHGSFAANVLLAGLQMYAAVSSRSLSFFTTLADAIFDPLSNVALMLSHRAVGRVNARRFPSGKARIETAGNIGFCFVMCALSLVLVVMSARVLLEGAAHERRLAKAAAANGGQSAGGSSSSSSTMTRPLHLPSVVAVSIAFATKAVLFAYCWSLRNQYSQVRILWQDHRNDIFINGFGLLTAIGGSRLRWWIDPAGALVLSVVIIVLWLRTAYAEFLLLIGVTANVELQQLITYICMSKSAHIFLFVLPRKKRNFFFILYHSVFWIKVFFFFAFRLSFPCTAFWYDVLKARFPRLPLWIIPPFFFLFLSRSTDKHLSPLAALSIKNHSHDALAENQADRHGARVSQRAAHDCRGGHRHGRRRHAARHARRGRGAAEQAREPARRGARVRARGLRDEP